jgi:hypothetical protein
MYSLYVRLHAAPVRYTPPQYATRRPSTLHTAQVRYTPPQYATRHPSMLHATPVHYTLPHYSANIKHQSILFMPSFPSSKIDKVHSIR